MPPSRTRRRCCRDTASASRSGGDPVEPVGRDLGHHQAGRRGRRRGLIALDGSRRQPVARRDRGEQRLVRPVDDAGGYDEEPVLVAVRAHQHVHPCCRACGDPLERRAGEHVAVHHRLERHDVGDDLAPPRRVRPPQLTEQRLLGGDDPLRRHVAQGCRGTRNLQLRGDELGDPGRGRGSSVWCAAPLCSTARRNRPVARGIASSAPMLIAPADSPATVTMSGSPPKAAMLSRTHSRAATWSRRPRFGGASGRSANPSTPSR